MSSTKTRSISTHANVIINYRPQRSCGQGYVFTRVCDSVHRGGGGSGQNPPCQGEPPPGPVRHPPETRQTPPPRPGRHPPSRDQADNTHPPRPGRPPRTRQTTPPGPGRQPPQTRQTPPPAGNKTAAYGQ